MITSLSIAAISQKLRSRELSVQEVAQAHHDRIAQFDPQVSAFLTINQDSWTDDIERAQKLLDANAGGPLTGVPVAYKDNISTQGLRTTCASKILENYIPPFDATVVEKLKALGAINVGKANLDEFAMGTSCENSAFGPTRNPWDLQRAPGGSSGGSAAAVSAGFVPVALGSDTGGSIRMPASLCGIVGYKPTYGRVSRYGLVAFGSSLDQIGPLTRTVEDAALVAEAISGHDPRDSTSLPEPPISTKELKSGSLKGLKLAIPKEMLSSDAQPGVLEQVQMAIDLLRKEGAEVSEISIPSIAYGVTTYYIIAPSEASSNLARFDGVRYGPRIEGEGHVGNVAATRGKLFGPEVKARIMVGTYALSAGYYDAYYLRAQQVRAMMSAEFETAFKDFDAIVSPSSPVVAFKIGELTNDPMALKLLDYCTIPANMGGFPAISINCGYSDGLPVGLQLMTPTMSDERLLQIAYCAEQALPDAQSRIPMA